jgi:hypothetical protein
VSAEECRHLVRIHAHSLAPFADVTVRGER